MSRSSVMMAVALTLLPVGATAADVSTSGRRTVYESVCMACHAAQNVMVAAPKAGDAADWGRRLARARKGIETLADHAVDGFGAMPAKGGREELTRAEIKDAIGFMMKPGS
jgi:cytochrome c5